jgi:hypothetical protein
VLRKLAELSREVAGISNIRPARLEALDVRIGVQGISEAEFHLALVQCVRCKRLLPKPALPEHRMTCPQRNRDRCKTNVFTQVGDGKRRGNVEVNGTNVWYS